MNNGTLVISLDFELHWGAVEKWGVSDTKDKFISTRYAVKEMLNLFASYNIHVTWATVGFLFAEKRSDIIECLPKSLPRYKNSALSSYNVLDRGELGAGESIDKSHYAASIIDLIKSYPNQEIASHTFSHYYALEEGQCIKTFEDDVRSSQMIAEKRGVQLKSLVFPRNQYNDDYLSVLRRYGILSVRSNPTNWIWSDSRIGRTSVMRLLKKLARGLDLILPVSNTLFTIESIQVDNPDRSVCIPASRFLRPYRSSEKIINKLKSWRVKNEMTKAAITGKTYHLWWHPHNFSNETKENLAYLEEILSHYAKLKMDHSFGSSNMAGLLDQITAKDSKI